MFVVILLILILVLLALLVMTAYNGFEQLRKLVEVAWRQVELELNRRSELMAKLDEAVAAGAGQQSGSPGLIALQQQLTQVEDRIAASTLYYNATVRLYNTKVETLPASFVASLCRFEKVAYFEGSDPVVRSVPAVSPGGQQ